MSDHQGDHFDEHDAEILLQSPISQNEEIATTAIEGLVKSPADDRQWREEMQKELARIESKVDAALELLKDIKERIEPEKVIYVREIPFDEAYELAKGYIQDKDLVDPLELADDLRIPYGQAHEIVLKLHDDDLIEPDH